MQRSRSNIARLASLLVAACLLLSCVPDTDTVKGAVGDVHATNGINAYQSGDYQEAVEQLQQALDLGVTIYSRAQIFTILGNAFSELEQYDNAIDAHNTALELDPESHEAWVNLGVVYRLTGDLDQAEYCYNQALSFNPDYPEAHSSLGVLYIVRGEPEKAVESLERAIELAPQYAVAYGNLALAYAIVGRFDDADAVLKQAIVLGYENAPIIRERIDELKAMDE